MGQMDFYEGYVGEMRSATAAGGGTALSTSAVLIPFPDNTAYLEMVATTFATAVVAKVALNPYLVILKTVDGLATRPTDYSDAGQDGATATLVTLSSLDTLANGDFLLVGSHVPFRGVRIINVAPNGNTATLAVAYWNGTAWASTSPTDGTASGGDTMAQNGDVTWTVPTAWTAALIGSLGYTAPQMYPQVPLYWTRWSVSAALDSSVTLSSFLALNRTTTYAELIASQLWAQRVRKGVGGIASVEALTDAGTANLIVNVASLDGF